MNLKNTLQKIFKYGKYFSFCLHFFVVFLKLKNSELIKIIRPFIRLGRYRTLPVTTTRQFNSLAIMASKDNKEGVKYKLFSQIANSKIICKFLDSDRKTPPPGKNNDEDVSENFMEKIAHFFADKLHLSSAASEDEDDGTVLSTVNIQGVVDAWQKGAFKNIVTMVGAGISTSAGIPDFRSPSSGLYHNLAAYNLPYPEAIFELDYFRENPQAFFRLAKELYPGTFKPTPSHYFVKMLQDKGLLLRHYSQNIDTLERLAGIDHEKLVEAHGTFYTNHCLDCNKEYSMEWVKVEIFADNVPTCTSCNGIVKPDIVFFGENLPERFHVLPHRDFKQCDLLIIMGTSLTVQ